jgi:hypothetical protein
MKIAVYGDSFACDKIIFSELVPKNINEEKLEKRIGQSWVNYFRQNNPTYTVDNYAVSGSCLWFSYRNYLRNYANYDKNIFVMTATSRISYINENGNPWSAGNLYTAEEHLKRNDYSPARKKFFKAASQYFRYIQDDEKDKEYWNLVKDKLIDNNVLVIFAHQYNTDSLDNLHAIMKKETLNMAVPKAYFTADEDSLGVDMRYNHLTKNNNIILAKMIEEHVKNRKNIFSFTIGDFSFDKEHTRQHMFKTEDFQYYMK